MAEITFIKSERGFSLMVHNNYKYSKIARKLLSGHTKWKCTKKICKAFIKTVEVDGKLRFTDLSKDVHHNLCVPICDNLLERYELFNLLKKKIKENIREKPGELTKIIKYVKQL